MFGVYLKIADSTCLCSPPTSNNKFVINMGNHEAATFLDILCSVFRARDGDEEASRGGL